ncbi:gpi mannosyltransferase 3 [Anaeramoeba ignava]|uniref:Gpi mannosyltransferase 3 n=1 Tax=Anaeramoeba ignava TaxID=1746090 RepID=A0A9Q0LNL3_ANAIG|nr:gpi mannosyltransferase 3 [Anaeramoeba ignava]
MQSSIMLFFVQMNIGKVLKGFLHPLIFAVLYKILQIFQLDKNWILILSPRILQAAFASLCDLFVWKISIDCSSNKAQFFHFSDISMIFSRIKTWRKIEQLALRLFPISFSVFIVSVLLDSFYLVLLQLFKSIFLKFNFLEDRGSFYELTDGSGFSLLQRL